MIIIPQLILREREDPAQRSSVKQLIHVFISGSRHAIYVIFFRRACVVLLLLGSFLVASSFQHAGGGRHAA